MAGLIGSYFLSGTGAPTLPPDLIEEWGFYQDDATGLPYRWNPIVAEWSELALAAIDYPVRASFQHENALVTAGNAILRVQTTGANYLIYSHQNTPANGDTFTQSFYLKAETYTLSVMGLTANNRGKLDWYVDTVLQGAGGQDWYAAGAGATYNVVKTQSITVAGDGYHVLKGVVNGKHASSSGYYITLTKYWITPSAD